MRKLKLLLTIFCLIGGGNFAFAQTDVTSTYLTNADFEGSELSYSQPKSDRDIYQPAGWSISYTNGETNDMTSLNSTTTCWSNFSGKPQPTNGGTKTYWMRFRWGNSENITLSQETSSALPAGTYAVSVDTYSDDNTGTVTISVEGSSQTVGTDGVWRKHAVVFTLAEAKKITVSLSYTNTAADDHAAAFDNVKILDLSSEPEGITLRNELGGTAASLSDFNVWYDDYTLEVEGTVGTAISVAADNISYTPDATGTVRFVKKDGIVYVFEGTSYKTAVHSSKADYTYTARTLSASDSETGNILKNGSFETAGDVLTANKAWKLGNPWVFANFSWGGDGSGIRVQLNGSTKRLVWRGSGNNAYFSQPLSLDLYKGYKVFLQQVGGGNANAKFNVGIGNAAGDYSYLSTQFTLGSGKDGTYDAVLGANKDIPASGAYFTFRNTSSNTASSGSDPVTQIDWIGLVGSDDFAISGTSSASYIYGTAYMPATAKATYEAAKAAAETTIEDAAYNNVAGEERTNLQAAIDASVDDDDEAYNTATSNIETAVSAFTSALSHYQALIDAQAAVPTLAYASTSAAAFKTAVATSASDADTKLAAMTNDIRTYYESHAMAEGVDGATDVTSLLTNYNNPSNTSGWTLTNTTGNSKMRTMSSESYTDADGTNNHSYFDTDSWGTAFSSTFMQNVELPAGKYILTAKARGNGTTTYQVMADGQTTDISSIGNTGGVFGRGWNDYTVEFTLAAKKTVSLGINMRTGSSGNWLSFGNFRLVRIEFTAATSTEYGALNSAISTAEANTLGFEDGQYAPYNNIDALIALANAKAVDQNVENAKADIDALTSALTGATWTANEGDVDAIFNGNFVETGTGNNPKGWSRSNNGWGQQITGLTEETNGVNAGTTTAWYYNNNGAWQYGNNGVYTMPLAADTKYVLSFKYRKNGNDWQSWMKASVLNSSDEGLEVAQFPGADNGTTFQTATAYFTTGAAGNYILSIEQNGNAHLTDVSLVKADDTGYTLTEGNKDALPALTYYETFTLARSFNAGWNAVCLPFATSAFDGAEIAEFTNDTAEGDDVTLNFEKKTAFEANKPYLVYFPDAVAGNKVFYGVNINPDDVKKEGTYFDFMGTYKAKGIDAGNWVISGGKLMKASAEISLKPTRTYFAPKSSSPGARIAKFVVDDEETTGLKVLFAEQGAAVEGLYNLKGQKVERAQQKGIYVVNGKKVVK